MKFDFIEHSPKGRQYVRSLAMKYVVLFSLATALVLSAAIQPVSAEMPLSVGANAPPFTLPSQDNTPVSLSDYKGKWVVLYFYPKDKTSGCTLEAHNFQRDLEKYKAANAVVIGVSLDTAGSHKSFCDQESLTLKLLADPGHKVVDAYGVEVKSFQEIKYASRQTYLIAPSGKIVKFWPSVDEDLDHHSANVLAEIAAEKK
jgi:thioredoxin-dependent peroxiredoxin